jgi:hypothetical protein
MIEAISDALYFVLVLSVPTLIGVCIGRGIKPYTNPADEALGRKVRQAVEDVRFRARFVNADLQVIYRGDLTVPADRATYSIAITRKASA